MRSRTAMVLLAGLVAGTAGLCSTSHAARPGSATDPVPIPGGQQVEGGPFLHVFAPGPTSLGFMGESVDPSTITHFNGSVAMAYLGGTATDANGQSYLMQVDVRAYEGEYVSCDGTHHHGTFGFV